MKPGFVLLSQNLIPYQSGVYQNRRGTISLNPAPWAGVTRVAWATRFNPSAASRIKLVAANLDAGDIIGSVDDSTGDLTPLTGMPAVGANQRWRGITAGEVPALYLGNNNATDGILKTTDGVNISQLAGVSIPAKGFPAGPYFDRLMVFTGKRVYYSRSGAGPYTDFTNPDTANVQYLFVNEDEDVEAVFLPGPDRTEVGFLGKLYICTPTSTWIHQGDFDGSQGAPTSSFTKIHERAGVSSFNTLAWVDSGVVGMGVDNVWYFPINGMPTAIGYEIEPVIRAIPAAYRQRCSAVFWKGFYILSYVRPGMTYADRELWCDLRMFQPAFAGYRAGVDTPASSQGITWHGPMLGRTLGVLVAQTQVPDENELFAYAATGGQCKQLETEVYTDDGAPITSILTTGDLGGDAWPTKVHEGFVIGCYVSDNDSVTVAYLVDEGAEAGSITFPLSGVGSRFDVDFWDSARWGGPIYTMDGAHWADRAYADKVRLTVTHVSAQPFAIKELAAIMHVLGRLVK